MDRSDGRGHYTNAIARDYLLDPVPQAITGFHLSMPGYEPTALLERPDLAESLGVGRVFVKEEARRFGLPSFKMVGASWAIYQTLIARTNEPCRHWSVEKLAVLFGGSEGLKLVCATDGNHGRAVSHMARLLNLSAHVFVPTQIGQRAKEAILGEGAELTEVDDAYDNVVIEAVVAAKAEPKAIIVQDTAWIGIRTNSPLDC